MPYLYLCRLSGEHAAKLSQARCVREYETYEKSVGARMLDYWNESLLPI